MSPLSETEIKEAFGHDNLAVVTSLAGLEMFIEHEINAQSVGLFMSSGNFGGLKL